MVSRIPCACAVSRSGPKIMQRRAGGLAHLYVTPLDERASTLCLFFRGPRLEDSSSLEPLALESDL